MNFIDTKFLCRSTVMNNYLDALFLDDAGMPPPVRHEGSIETKLEPAGLYYGTPNTNCFFKNASEYVNQHTIDKMKAHNIDSFEIFGHMILHTIANDDARIIEVFTQFFEDSDEANCLLVLWQKWFHGQFDHLKDKPNFLVATEKVPVGPATFGFQKPVKKRDKTELDKIKFSNLTKKQKMDAILCNKNLVEAAINITKNRLFREKTKKSYNSLVSTYVRCCFTAEIEPWPISQQGIEAVSAALNFAGYKCVQNTWVAVFAYQENILEKEVSFDLRTVRKRICKILEQDHKTKQMEPLFHSDILAMYAKVKYTGTVLQLVSLHIMTVCVNWLLRVEECISLQWFEVHVNVPQTSVSIDICKDKTSKNSDVKTRTLFCNCKDKKASIESFSTCPFCSWIYFIEKMNHLTVNLVKLDGYKNKSIFVDANKKISYQKYHGALLDLLKKANFHVRHPSIGNLFGTHSFRRGGAQTLLLNNVSIEEIRVFGRWSAESTSIRLYLLECGIFRDARNISRAIVGKQPDTATIPCDYGALLDCFVAVLLKPLHEVAWPPEPNEAYVEDDEEMFHPFEWHFCYVLRTHFEGLTHLIPSDEVRNTVFHTKFKQRLKKDIVVILVPESVIHNPNLLTVEYIKNFTHNIKKVDTNVTNIVRFQKGTRKS